MSKDVSTKDQNSSKNKKKDLECRIYIQYLLLLLLS